MKKNQNGFGAIGVVALLLIVGLTCAVGWLVWDRRTTSGKKTALNTQTQQLNQATNKSAKEESTDTSPSSRGTDELQKGEIKKIDTITLLSVSDTEKLPAYTPASFKDYVANDFNIDNRCADRGTLRYTVDVISLDTISGVRHYCGEGFSVIWYLDLSEKWNLVSLENACTIVNNGGGDGTKVSATFMKSAMHDMCSSFTDTKY